MAVSTLREEEKNRMVAEGKTTHEEGGRLPKALEKSRSGEAGREIARRGRGKKAGRWRPYAVIAVVLLAAGAAVGLYLGLRGGESAGSLFDKGAEAFEEGRYKEAAGYYKKALEKKPESSVGYNLLGMASRFLYIKTRDAGYRKKEIAAFRKAVELDPRSYAPLINLGATLYEQGSRKEGAAYLEKALEIFPNHPDRAQIEEMVRQAQ
jgi:tetratricopeptide (TPR) repeat protein